MDAALGALERQQLRNELAPAAGLLAIHGLGQLGFALTVATGVGLIVAGRMEAALLVGFLPLALRFSRTMAELGNQLVELRFARQTLDSIRLLLDEPAMRQPEPGEHPVGGDVALENVSFSHGDGSNNEVDGDAGPELRNVSGFARAGARIALVGASGAGKSTLAHLIARLWDVDSGCIRIGGVDIRNMSARTLSETIAMVPQDVTLFDGTLADNIRLGRLDATDAGVALAARAAPADGFIEALPNGYATMINAADTQLSGCERQRIAIARALLRDAPVLILDEATAHLDLEHEADILAALDALAGLMRGRTVFIVAHRLWTIADADEIWVMDAGRIVERGSHQALMQRHGRYRQLWDAQDQARSWKLGARQVDS